MSFVVQVQVQFELTVKVRSCNFKSANELAASNYIIVSANYVGQLARPPRAGAGSGLLWSALLCSGLLCSGLVWSGLVAPSATGQATQPAMAISRSASAFRLKGHCCWWQSQKPARLASSPGKLASQLAGRLAAETAPTKAASLSYCRAAKPTAGFDLDKCLRSLQNLQFACQADWQASWLAGWQATPFERSWPGRQLI